MAQGNRQTSISLEDLIMLNDEIAALVRAGVPLDRGLLATGRDMPGRLGSLTTSVAIELGRGSSLVEAIDSDSVVLPGVYRAVVASGLRSGRLAAALESVAELLRRLAESRREITATLIYPLLVVIIAWCVGYGLFHWTLPSIHATLGESPLTDWLPIVQGAWYWAGAIPIVLVVLAAWVWYWSGRATLIQGRASTVLLGWVPWVGSVVRTTRIATFTEVLALLVENNVPLDQAVVLAAETTGQPQMIASARNLAEHLRAGQPLDRQRLGELAIPPMLAWMICCGLRRRALLSTLRHAATTYRRRIRRALDAARIFLPVLFTIVIGGLAVMITGLGLFLPYLCMLHTMAKVW